MTPELETRIRQALANLATLSEAAAGSPPELSPPSDLGTGRKARKIRAGEWGRRSKSQTRHSESSPPAGARLDLDADRPPPKERSLHDWYEWEFLNLIRRGAPLAWRARGFRRDLTVVDLLENLCDIAELEYKERRFHSPERVGVRSGELTENDVQDGGAAERTAAKRIVEWYEGWSAAEVAHRERTTEVWVRKARKEHGRKGDDGTPLPEFLELDEEGRKQKALEMYNQLRAEMRAKGISSPMRGVGAKIAADRLGVSKGTLQRYWPAEGKLADFQARLADASRG